MTPSRGALRPRDFLLVALLALLSHLRSVGNQLVFDDRSAILENLTVTGAFDLRRLFAFDFWGLPAGQGVGTWRPLVTLSFIVDRRIGGGAAWAFHLTNLLAHVATALLLTIVVAGRLRNRRLALWAGSIFAVLAVQTDAVASAVGRADVLAAAFLLASLWSLGPSDAPTRPSRLVAGSFFTGLALLCKESALVAPVLFYVLDATLFAHEAERVGSDDAGTSPGSRARRVLHAFGVPRPWALRYLVTALTCAAYLAVRACAIPLSAIHVTRWDNPLLGEPIGVRALTALKLTLLSLRAMLVPLNLAPDYSSAEILPVRSLLSGEVLAGALLVGLASLVCIRFRRRAPALAFAVALWLVPWALVSNLVVPGAAIFAERLLYLPSAGFAVGLALLCERLFDRSRVGAVTLLTVVVTSNLLLCVQEDGIWHDELSLFREGVETAPRCARAWNNYGSVLLRVNRVADALAALDRAAEILPEWPAPHRLSAVAWKAAGRLTEEEQQLRLAAALSKTYPDQLELARFLLDHNRAEEARAVFSSP